MNQKEMLSEFARLGGINATNALIVSIKHHAMLREPRVWERIRKEALSITNEPENEYYPGGSNCGLCELSRSKGDIDCGNCAIKNDRGCGGGLYSRITRAIANKDRKGFLRSSVKLDLLMQTELSKMEADDAK